MKYQGEKDFIEDEKLTFLGPEDIKSFQIKYKMAHVPLIDTKDSYYDSNFWLEGDIVLDHDLGCEDQIE